MNGRRHNTARRAAAIVVALLLSLAATSCDFVNRVFSTESSSTITSELFEDVSVDITGTVMEAESGDPLEGITVDLIETDPSDDGETTIGTATTGASGAFTIEPAETTDEASRQTEAAASITLAIDTKQYHLSVSDSDGTYYENNATLVYSVKDATGDDALSYEIILVPKNPVSETQVRGAVFDGLTRTARLPGVTVKLTDTYDSSSTYSTTTIADSPETETNEAGTFSLTVPVSSYRVEYDGSDLESAEYIIEHEDVVLRNALTNDLGVRYIIPEIPDGEYRVVLQWRNDDENWYELRTYLDVFSSTVPIVNSLGPDAGDVEIEPRFSLNPGTGFAKETPYWPTSIVPSGDRRFVNGGNPLRVAVGSGEEQTVIDIKYDETSGSGRTPIEVITLYQQSPIDSFPENLTYYYRPDVGVSHYPIGVYNMVVTLPWWEGEDADAYGIYGSNAEVKLYSGSTFQGAFDIGSFLPNERESNKRTWDVLFIEVGFTRASPTSVDDLYLRPVPFFSQWPENELWGQPPFLTQVRYLDTPDTTDGTDAFGEITALYYDTDWGLFIGTASSGVKAMWQNDFQADTITSDWTPDRIAGLTVFEGELLVLNETAAGTGTVRYPWDGVSIVAPPGSAPADVDVVYSNPKAEDQVLLGGTSSGLYAYRWVDGTGFTWEEVALGGTTGLAVTDLSTAARSIQDPVGAIIADGKVFVYEWPTDSFVELDMSELGPPGEATGSLVRGGFYGYADAFIEDDMDNQTMTKVFWGITDAGEVYVNKVVRSEAGDPPSFTYTYGVSKLVAVEPATAFDGAGFEIYDIESLMRPGEGYAGQPILGTSAGPFHADYEEFEAEDLDSSGTIDPAEYFTLKRYPFAPSDLIVKTITSTYETTFFGTESNGVVTTLGGVF